MPRKYSLALIFILLGGTTSLFALLQTPDEVAEEAAESFLLHVLDDRTGNPVPFATVYLFDAQQHDTYLWPQPKDADYDLQHMFERHGVAYPTNELGQVQAPRPTHGLAMLAASKGQMFGRIWTVRENGDTEIRLLANHVFRVHLVDTEDRPIANRKVSLSHGFMSMVDLPFLTATTDQDGLAILRWNEQQTILQGNPSMRLHPWILGGPEVSIEVDSKKPPAETLQLVLPPCADLRVNLLDSAGQPLLTPVLVQLDILHKGTGTKLDQASVMTEQGIATFAQVVQGRKLVLTCSDRESGSEARHEIPNFAATGTATDASLRLVQTSAVLTGILLGQNQQPLLNQKFAFNLLQQDGPRHSVHRGRLLTDAEGRFRFSFKPMDLGDATERNLIIQQRDSESKPADEIRLQLGAVSTAGEIDLGSLTLQPASIVAQGRVLDANGNGVAEAKIYVERAFAATGSTTKVWHRDPLLKTKSTEDGSYQVIGVLDAADSRLVVEADGFPQTTTVLRSAQRHYDLHLVPSQWLKLQLLLDPEIDQDAVSVVFQIYPTHGPGPRNRQIRLMAKSLGDGLFQVPDPPLGYGSFVVACSKTGSQLARVDGLVLEPNSPLEDAQLDLRGKLHQFTIRPVKPDQTPISGFQIAFPATQRARSWAYEDSIQVTTTDPSPNFLVSSKDTRTVLIRNCQGQQNVVLGSPFPIQLSLSSPLDLPQDFYLAAHLTSTDPAYQDPFLLGRKRIEFKQNANVEITLDRYGYFQVRYYLYGPVGKKGQIQNAGIMTKVDAAKSFIQVEDASGKQSFLLTVDPEGLQLALESLKRRK
ncbi:MAG: carboxypeptidase-like regulatory domain-containing protein [Planctomycetota bacterium]